VSTAKSLFLHRESDVWDSLRSQQVVLAEANERLAHRSVEVADLRLLCDELKSEAVSARAEALSAREHVASQAEEMRLWQLELGQAIGERDQSRSQAAEAMSRAEALRGQLAEATERLEETSVRAEGMFCPLVTLFLSPFFFLRLKKVVLLSAGFETTLDESAKNCKALAEAAERKEAERVAMSEAISAFCQAFGLDGVPSGSSPPESSAGLGRPCAQQTPWGAAPWCQAGLRRARFPLRCGSGVG
jgi:hypothetical protein